MSVRANGAEICVETFGDPADPTILLIMGAAASMDWWPDGFCRRLAGGTRHVVRYDHRDTGQSTTYEPGSPGYSFSDLIRDAVGLLDELDVARAHLVGMSMGGGIAQHLAFEYPQRVASLTLIATSPASPTNAQTPLPPMSEELRRLFAEPSPQPDWSNRDEVISYTVAGTLPFQGAVRVDERSLRHLIARVVDRSQNMASTMTNHWILDGGEVVEGRLEDIGIPTLVVHGTEDPLFPFEHAEALARAIPGATLLALEGVGHGELPEATWDVVISPILDVTSVATGTQGR
jgi:pimeloyl-ACP methyl ester carboxylesterase